MGFTHSARIVAHSWTRRLLPSGRQALRALYEALHDGTAEPGLTNIDEQGFVRNEGLDIAWFAVGPPADKAHTTVVFIHGYALSSESFYDQVNFLRAYPGVRSLLIDVRGHGLSTTATPAECNVDGAASDVLAVIDKCAPIGKLVVMGHSLGGMIALAVIRQATPEVFARMESAVLVGASMRRFAAKGIARLLETKLLDMVYRTCARLPEKVNAARYELAQFVAPAMAALVAGFPRMERIQFHVAMLLDTPLPSFVGYFEDLLDNSEFDSAERLSQLKGVVMVGTADIVTPESQAELICKHWPHAELVKVEHAGHMLILEDPEAVSRALEQVLR